jgi:mannose-6-phosphate isomerase-like protein (cupin superfamily)
MATKEYEMSIGMNFGSDWNQLMEESELKKSLYRAPETREVVIRPWGKYETTYNGPGYKTKVITVNPGQRLSLQRHKWRDEHWFIVEGKADVTVEGVNYGLFTFNHINICNGKWHRVTNNQQTPLVLIEIQTGNCFEEDIERKEDDYGRA